MISLLSPTNSIAEDEIRLTKGQLSPYQGVLVPDGNYRFYQELREQYPFVKELAKEPVENNICWETVAIVGLTGMVLGFMLANQIKQDSKHALISW